MIFSQLKYIKWVKCIKANVITPSVQTVISKNLSGTVDDTNDNFDLKVLQNAKRLIKTSNYSFKDGYTCIKTECPVCPPDEKQPRTTVYINKTTGSFLCPKCQHTASWKNVATFFDKHTSIPKQDLEKLRQIFLSSKKEKQFYVNRNANDLIPVLEIPKELANTLNIENIISELHSLGVKFNPKERSLHFNLLNSEKNVVGEKILKADVCNEEFTYPKDGCSGLLIYSLKQKDLQKAIIVLNVMDFIAVVSQKIEGASVVCLPYGLKSLPQECLPTLEPFKELILWFDFDVTGWDIARNYSKKLDEKRCRFIRPTSNQPTPYKAIQNGIHLETILNNAQPILHKSITTFSSLKQDVLSELQNIEKVNGVKWKRYPTLNKLLKGHRKGELTVLTGPTGCGKTTFMSEYSLDLAIQGVTTLWGSFEIRNTRLATTLLRQYVGYPLDEKLEEFEYWSQELEKLPIYFMTFHGQQSIKVVMEAIEHAQYVHDIQHVIIDNVQFMLGVSSGLKHSDKFWEQDIIIASFRTFATKHNVHVTLVMHPRKERDADELTTSSIFGSAKATQEADNVLIIQDRRLTSVRGKKFLQVAKNRYSGDLGIMPLEFDKDALSYAKKKKDK